MTQDQVWKWLDDYSRAWRERDPDAAAALFTESVVYRSHPFREPHVGRRGVREYWLKATADQRRIELRFGHPIVEGSHVAVEWWAVMTLVGKGTGTLPGALILRFAPSGLCEELREYWHWKEETIQAPMGWGI
jgi:hypothetical protein